MTEKGDGVYATTEEVNTIQPLSFSLTILPTK